MRKLILPYDKTPLNSTTMFMLINIYRKYNNNFDDMLKDNIITKKTWIEETYYYCMVMFDWKNLDRYDVIPIDEETIYKVFIENKVYKVVDTYKIVTDKSERFTPKYKKWRTDVFERDEYTCQHCNQVGGKLNTHHIKPYKEFKELRTVLENGITLCYECHKKEHIRLRGTK